jgi:hypothetical protein
MDLKLLLVIGGVCIALLVIPFIFKAVGGLIKVVLTLIVIGALSAAVMFFMR